MPLPRPEMTSPPDPARRRGVGGVGDENAVKGFPRAAVPAALVPMKLPLTVLLLVVPTVSSRT